ncbi:MAG: hypothetical protein NTY48_04355, partial [Candidatus Diapherotrites archaeon]|nr:hypothetical protein [Candidatus Diapherotrites archaeon]
MNIKEKEAEFLGALSRDGYVSLACGKYIVGFTGHPEDDLLYYSYLAGLFFDLCGKKPKIGVRLRGLRMKVCSKQFCFKLIQDFGFVAGENKSYSIQVPSCILPDWSLLRHFIRGFVDTDGSVFFSKKPGVEKYPAIELNTCSVVLAEQLREALLCAGFRVT